jgi:hypothetical protein
MERLFLRSGLYRPDRWNRAARSGETYGQGSIRLAIAKCKSFYNPMWTQQHQEQAALDGPGTDHQANPKRNADV